MSTDDRYLVVDVWQHRTLDDSQLYLMFRYSGEPLASTEDVVRTRGIELRAEDQLEPVVIGYRVPSVLPLSQQQE